MSSPQQALGRSAAALLRDRIFGPFLVGKMLSSTGIWIENIAAAVLMYQLTESAFMVGAVSMMQFAGPLVLSIWTGALTDRVDRRRLLIVARLISGLAVGTLAGVLAVFGEDFGGPPVLLACVCLVGVGHAISVPSMQALVPSLVPAEDLEPALALNSAGPGIARTIGPVAGAALLLLGGPALAFAVSALSQLAFAMILAVMRVRTKQRSDKRPSLLGGLRYVVEQRAPGLLILAIALAGFGMDPVITLTPALADRLGGGEQLVGFFATTFGVGAVVATFLFRRLRRALSLRLVGVGGFWVLAGGLVVVAAAPLTSTVAIGFFIAGAGFIFATVSANARIQTRVPDELRGRVMALWGVAFLGSRPFAAAVNGSVADHVSLSVALLVAAAIVLAASLLVRVRFEPITDPTGALPGSADRSPS